MNAKPTEARVTRREIATLAICCTAIFMVSLDNTVLNVALPSLQRSFRSTPSGLQWAVDAYLLVRGGSLFVSGSISDRFGRRRLFNIGQMTFILGSLACALAPSLGMLIGFRAFQGFGSALMTPATLAIIANTFTSRARRAQAFGFWSATTGVSTAFGPLIGGALVDSFGWRSVFWINVPIGLLALLGTRILSESRAEKPRPFDIPGQLLISGGLFITIYVLITAPDVGWSSHVIVVLIPLALLCIFTFPLVERRRLYPLLEPSDFKNPPLIGGTILAVVTFLTTGAFLFFNTLYLQEVRGFSPFHAGLTVLPFTALTIVLAPISGRITGTRGPRTPSICAVVLIGTAMTLMAIFIRPNTPIDVLLAMYLVLGFGNGLVNPPITNAAISNMPKDRAGVASAVTGTARQVGTTLGVALIGSIVFSIARIGNSLSATHGHAVSQRIAQSFTHALRYGYGTAAFLAIGSLAAVIWAFKPSNFIESNLAEEVAAPIGSSKAT